jgi:Family of unknown function (DUF6496)
MRLVRDGTGTSRWLGERISVLRSADHEGPVPRARRYGDNDPLPALDAARWSLAKARHPLEHTKSDARPSRVSRYQSEVEEAAMTETKTVEYAQEDIEEGKSPSTAAGEFVREEMHHIREGKHGARSTKQAIAIGLSKARRAGVPLKPPSKGRTSERTHEAAERAYETGQGQRKPRASSRKRARAVSKALKREGRGAASKAALSRQAKRSAQERRRTSRSPQAAAQRGAATRMRLGIASEAARKAARTRKQRRTRR